LILCSRNSWYPCSCLEHTQFFMFNCIFCFRLSAGCVSAANAVWKYIFLETFIWILTTLIGSAFLNYLLEFALLSLCLFYCFWTLFLLTLYKNMVLCIRCFYLCVLGTKFVALSHENHIIWMQGCDSFSNQFLVFNFSTGVRIFRYVSKFLVLYLNMLLRAVSFYIVKDKPR
jgi:hypothetical protein